MRIVLNTRRDDAGAGICIHDLSERLRAFGVDATLNDWGGYAGYEVAVFMGYDHELERARRENPEIRVVLADPKISHPERLAAAREADLLLVSSVEQRDVFVGHNPCVHVHLMFPRTEERETVHREREGLIVAYHGNRIHIESFVDRLRPALEAMARSRPVELRLVYNKRDLGSADLGVPRGRGLTVHHVQWSPNLVDDLAGADIGLVPTELPVAQRLAALELTALDRPELGYEPFDHLVRFKASANPGRVYPFARAGVPVVADFTPSVAQVVEDGVSGFVVSSAHGWLWALRRLAESPELRNAMAARLREHADALYERQIPAFLEALHAPPQEPLELPPPDLGAELARWERMPRPTAPLFNRVQKRLRRYLER